MLVLAGPGSGKTRVLVHRIAYLIRARRENSRGILALAYNRHAAVEIRRRLGDLIGDDARGVTVLTCHGLAMRLAGASFSGRAERPDSEGFQEVMQQAVALLRGEGLPTEEADEQRERLLAGFRWILVDEYQDIDADQYELISALAGRTLEDEDRKLTLFAVGDDDQNIYAFNGASVEFLRRFEADYGSKPAFLTDNYRSTGHIISTANALIDPARQRMKTGHPIHIDRARAKDSAGGAWRELVFGRSRPGADSLRPAQSDLASASCNDGVSTPRRPFAELGLVHVRGNRPRVEIPGPGACVLRSPPHPGTDGKRRNPEILAPAGNSVSLLNGYADARTVGGRCGTPGLGGCTFPGPWIELLREALDEHALETGGAEVPVGHFIEWLAEWGRDVRRRQRGLLLLTAHRAKGLEFDHVAVLDGGWDKVGESEDPDAPRRLYYVAITRARQTLTLTSFPGSHSLQDTLRGLPSVLCRQSPVNLPPETPGLARQYRRPALGEIDLGFAGRHYVVDPVHRAIAALSPGDPLEARVNERGRWELLNRSGTVVGRLANTFKPPHGTRCSSATVLAVVAWSRASAPQYKDSVKCDTWEVVVPELVFDL